ncbi:hypothetical protein AB6A40_011614 [Gnathostoma spinigerum]|uniref:Uncharacterized protein n=1 Tax=Gnathostoma spinigerum TaxID=75299 RepID=A0ABD6EY74_9BILA
MSLYIYSNEIHPFGVKVITLEPGLFKTPLIGVEKINTMIQGVWDKAPLCIREEYGTGYIEFYKNAVTKYLMKNASDRVHKVVNAYFDAITLRFPDERYRITYLTHGLLVFPVIT